MSFKLEVEFTGLCLFVVHPQEAKVAVVMPDARATPRPVVFDDGEIGAPHVGYVSCSLADVLGDPTATGDVVHRFDREELHFDLADPSAPRRPAAATAVDRIQVPNADRFAPQLQPLTGMFATPPANEVLMRAVLDSGEFGSAATERWDFDAPFGDPANSHGDDFAERVTWTTTVDADYLALRFASWQAGTETTLRLTPTQEDGVVRLRVANLCAHNPLEWRDFGVPRTMAGRGDEDFRWFYRLLEPKSAAPLQSLLAASGAKLPIPYVDRRARGGRSNPPGCEPSRITARF